MTLTQTQCALITGASSGIGKATAIAFSKAGIDLVLVGRNQQKLDEVALQTRSFGVEVKVFIIDLADVSQVQGKISALVSTLPRLDIVINNAGMGYTNGLLETPLADWQRVIDLNLTSVFQVIQGVLPTMRSQKRGTIINLSSVAAHQAFPNWGLYCVSKFGLLALTKTLAAEERSHGIRAISMSPGSVNTELWDTDSVQADFDRSAMLTPDVVAASILYAAQMPQGAAIEEMILLPTAGTF
ncbi:MAG: SDR family oxidoreductase [Cyanobacteria bacterium]|nr:SDR family oxidoreductase [Cyanobacteriota bacterium]